jgi:hypothetical protein
MMFRWGRRSFYVACQALPEGGRPQSAMVCPTKVNSIALKCVISEANEDITSVRPGAGGIEARNRARKRAVELKRLTRQ